MSISLYCFDLVYIDMDKREREREKREEASFGKKKVRNFKPSNNYVELSLSP